MNVTHRMTVVLDTLGPWLIAAAVVFGILAWMEWRR